MAAGDGQSGAEIVPKRDFELGARHSSRSSRARQRRRLEPGHDSPWRDQRAQRLAPFGIGTVHGYGYRLEAEDRRRLMGMIEEHFVNKDFAGKDNRERAIRCSDCSRSEGKIVEMALIRIEPSGVSG